MRKLLVILLALAVGVFLYAENVTVSWSGSAIFKLKVDENGVDVSNTTEIDLAWAPFSGSVQGTPVTVSFKWTFDDVSDEGGEAALVSLDYSGDMFEIGYTNGHYSYKNYIVASAVPDSTTTATIVVYNSHYGYVDAGDEGSAKVEELPSDYDPAATAASFTNVVVTIAGYKVKPGDYVYFVWKGYPDLKVYFADLKSDTWNLYWGLEDKDKTFFDDLLAAQWSSSTLPMVAPSVYIAYYPVKDKSEFLVDASLGFKDNEFLKPLSVGVFFANTAVGTPAMAFNASYSYSLTATPVTANLSIDASYKKGTNLLHYSALKSWMQGTKVTPTVSAKVALDPVDVSLNVSVPLKADTEFKNWAPKLSVDAKVSAIDAVNVGVDYSADKLKDIKYHNALDISLDVDLEPLAGLPLSISGVYKMEHVSAAYANLMDMYDSPIYVDGEHVTKDTDMSAYYAKVNYKIGEGLNLSFFYGTYYTKYLGKIPGFWSEKTLYFDPDNGKLYYDGSYTIKTFSKYNSKYPKWYLTLSYSTSF